MTLTELTPRVKDGAPAVRRAAACDQAELTALAHALHADHRAPIERFFQLPSEQQARHIFLVAEHLGRIVGYVFTSPRVLPREGDCADQADADQADADQWDHNTAVLRQLAVLPSYRAGCVSADLLGTAMSEAAALWYSQIIAYVEPGDAEVYASAGWSVGRPGCSWSWLERSHDLDSDHPECVDVVLMTEAPDSPRVSLARFEIVGDEYLAVGHRLDSAHARSSALKIIADAFVGGDRPSWLYALASERGLLDNVGALAHLTTRRPFAAAGTQSRVA